MLATNFTDDFQNVKHFTQDLDRNMYEHLDMTSLISLNQVAGLVTRNKIDVNALSQMAGFVTRNKIEVSVLSDTTVSVSSFSGTCRSD